ncbi:MAG: PEP-CTERM sorting domain-containing protein [Colwellia sp.]|nr:PEP-CTERM sorting domain-containing protein [Colwellia sp.]
MRFSLATLTLFILLTVTASPSANASLITFEDIPAMNISESTFTEAGYVFEMNKKALSTGEDCGIPTCVDNGSKYLLINYFPTGESFFSFARTDGLGFDFFGFDLGEGQVNRANNWAATIEISAVTMTGETINQSFNLDHINDGDAGIFEDFQTFTTNNDFTNLAFVVVNGFGAQDRNSYSVDNIQLSSVTVPEPASIFLLLLALLFVFGNRITSFKKS